MKSINEKGFYKTKIFFSNSKKGEGDSMEHLVRKPSKMVKVVLIEDEHDICIEIAKILALYVNIDLEIYSSKHIVDYADYLPEIVKNATRLPGSIDEFTSSLFESDILLIDHNLYQAYKGSDIVNLMTSKSSGARILGISSTHVNYCEKQFLWDKRDLQNKRTQEVFIAFINEFIE